MKDLLILSDIILPISSDPIENGAVVVSDGPIVDFGHRRDLEKKYSSFKKLIYKECIILPGFINAHIHLELGWIKNKLGNYKNFIEWLQQIIKAKKDDVSNEILIESITNGIEEQIKSGVTTVGEISSYNGIDIPILKNSGLRTILFKEYLDRNIDLLDSGFNEPTELYEERLFPHSPYSCSPETLDKIFNYTLKHDLALGIHLAESKDETNFLKNLSNGFDNIIYPLLGRKCFTRVSTESPVKYISKFNKKLKSQLTCIHMVNINKNDIEFIKNDNIGVVLCPRSNILLNVGKPNFSLLINTKKIGLGTDGISSNYNLNFIEEIRTIHNLLLDENFDDSTFLSIYFATLGGAKALFIDEKIGSIEKGKEADLLCVHYGNEKPVDPYLSVISSNYENIEFTMVKGNFLYNKNEHQ